MSELMQRMSAQSRPQLGRRFAAWCDSLPTSLALVYMVIFELVLTSVFVWANVYYPFSLRTSETRALDEAGIAADLQEAGIKEVRRLKDGRIYVVSTDGEESRIACSVNEVTPAFRGLCGSRLTHYRLVVSPKLEYRGIPAPDGMSKEEFVAVMRTEELAAARLLADELNIKNIERARARASWEDKK